MVNKCCVVGCKSLYSKDMVKVHRFPLENKRTLPFWVVFTGKEPGWSPTESSRLCCNHFIKSDYIVEHKKGVLKPTSVPSIKYKIEVPQFRKIHPNLQKKKYYQETKNNIKPNSSSNYDDYHNNGKNHNEVVQYENRYNSSYQNNNDVCNRKKWNNSMSINNCTDSLESRIIISPTENHNGSFLNTMEQIKNSTFNKIMNLKSKKPRCSQTIYSLYFKSPKISKILSQGESINSLNYIIEDTITDNSGTIFCNSS